LLLLPIDLSRRDNLPRAKKDRRPGAPMPTWFLTTQTLAALGRSVLLGPAAQRRTRKSCPPLASKMALELVGGVFALLRKQIGKSGFWRNSSAKETSLSKSV